MMKILLPLMIIAAIGGIAGVVFMIKAIRKNIDKEYKGANIISFLFPVIGLIIYAVNIGKNDKLAKSCVKAALFGMGFSVALVIAFYCIYLTFYYGVYNLNTTHHKATKTQVVETKNMGLDDIKKTLLRNTKVTKCDVREAGLIVYIDITFTDNTSAKDAKNIAESIFDNNLDDSYDYTMSLYIGDDMYYGHRYKDLISWTK